MTWRVFTWKNNHLYDTCPSYQVYLHWLLDSSKGT